MGVIPKKVTLPTLNTLSRLKGIETWSRIALATVTPATKPLNTLSRLKGIETISVRPKDVWVINLWIHFPVWRELKRSEVIWVFASVAAATVNLWIHFPVWRELKQLYETSLNFPPKTLNTLSRLKGIETAYRWAGWVQSRKKTLNTLSRLKGIETSPTKSVELSGKSSEYTFPFEGNWNLYRNFATNNVVNHSEYTFPFEGNWNSPFFASKRAWLLLWIHFPVWRELKLS